MEASGLKYPKFDGKKKHWEAFKTEFEGCLAAQSRLRDYNVLLKSEDDDVLMTNEEGTKAQKTLRDQDVEVFTSLLKSISKKKSGRKARELVSTAKNSDYHHGSFKLAWEILTKVYEQSSKATLKKLQLEYLTMKMGKEEEPLKFVLRMSEVKRVMAADHGYEIEDEMYFRDVVDRLPKAYRSKKKELLKQIESDGDDKITNQVELIMELQDEYSDLYPHKAKTGLTMREDDSDEECSDDEESSSDDDSNGDKALYAGYYKGRCNRCGGWGHKASQCPTKKGHAQPSGVGSNREFRRCHYCKEKGHIVKNCPTLKAKKEQESEEDTAVVMEEIGDCIL